MDKDRHATVAGRWELSLSVLARGSWHVALSLNPSDQNGNARMNRTAARTSIQRDIARCRKFYVVKNCNHTHTCIIKRKRKEETLRFQTK
jgi:hypothetical protein